MRRASKKIGAALLWTALTLLAVGASSAYHLSTPLAAEATRVELNEYVSAQMRGRLELGRVQSLSTEEIIVRHVALYDADGERVIVADRVTLVIDLDAAAAGWLRFSHARLEGGTVRLIDDGSGLPTLLGAFESATPPVADPGAPFHAVVDDMHLSEVTVYGDVLGVRGLRVENMRVHGRMEFEGGVDIRVWDADGDIVAPWDLEGARLERLVARIDSDARVGTWLYAEASAGAERVEANLTYRLPQGAVDEDGPQHLDLLLHASPVHPETLAEVGLDFAAVFEGPVAGHVGLRGPPDDLELRGWLEHDGGHFGLEGRLPTSGDVNVTLRTPELDLGSILPGAPDLRVTGEMTLIAAEGEDGETRFALELEGFDFEGFSVPPVTVHGVLEDEGVRIDRAETPYAGGELEVEGRVDYDGPMDLRVRARLPQIQRDPNLRAIVPGLRGGLRADVRVRRDAEGEALAFRGSLLIAPFRYGAVTADWVRITGSLGGDPSHPAIDADISAAEVAISDYPLGDGTLEVQGGPRRYRTAAHFLAPGERRTELEATVGYEGGRYILDSDHIVLAVGDIEWRGSAQSIVLSPSRQLSFERVLLAAGVQRLEASGVYRFHAADDFSVDVQGFDLAFLRVLLPEEAPDITGTLDSRILVHGDVSRRPEVVVEGSLTGATMFGFDAIEASFLGAYTADALKLYGDIGIAGRGSVVVDGQAFLDPEAPLDRAALEVAEWDVRLSADEADLALATALLEDFDHELTGAASGHLRFTGFLDAPTFAGRIEVPELVVDEWPSVHLATTFDYRQGALSVSFATVDEHGPFVDGEASSLVDVSTLLEASDTSLEALAMSPWRLSLRMPPRPLTNLPQELRELVPMAEDLEAGINLTLVGGAFSTRGDFFADVRYTGQLSGPCATDADPRGSIQGRLRDDVTVLETHLMLGDAQALFAEAKAETPINDWLAAGEVPELPITSLLVGAQRVELSSVPYLCQHATGPLSLLLEAEGLFGDAPLGRFGVHSETAQARRLGVLRSGRRGVEVETPPVRLTLDARIEDGLLSTEADIAWRGGGRSTLRGTLPVSWGGADVVPAFAAEAPLSVEAVLDGLPLAFVMAFVPGFNDVGGSLDGEVGATGTLGLPDLSGELVLTDGRLDIESVGQRLDPLEGTVRLAGTQILLDDIIATDGNGFARVHGVLELSELLQPADPEEAHLGVSVDLIARGFPVRNEGSVLARLLGESSLVARIDGDGLFGRVDIQRLEVELTDDSARSTQELTAHPDVQIMGRVRELPTDDERFRVGMHVTATEGFTVRSPEFEAAVTADLDVFYDDPGMRVGGAVEVVRGEFFVFGKEFSVERASMAFRARDRRLDPGVSMVAVHQLRGTNTEVRVEASGQLSNPRIRFRSDHASCQSEGEVISLLLTGQCPAGADAGAELAGAEQASDFLAGLALGVLSLSLQESLGDVVRISVDRGDAGSTRARFGFNADRILPERIRRVVQGVYVEGYVESQQTDSSGVSDETQSRTGTGLLLEIQWPRSIVTTGAFDRDGSWSLDVTWEP